MTMIFSESSFWTVYHVEPKCWHVLHEECACLCYISAKQVTSSLIVGNANKFRLFKVLLVSHLHDVKKSSTCAFCVNCVSLLPQSLIQHIVVELQSLLALKRVNQRDRLKAVTAITLASGSIGCHRSTYIFNLPSHSIPISSSFLAQASV